MLKVIRNWLFVLRGQNQNVGEQKSSTKLSIPREESIDLLGSVSFVPLIFIVVSRILFSIQECRLCSHCLSNQHARILKEVLQEHLQRGTTRLVYPYIKVKKYHISQAFVVRVWEVAFSIPMGPWFSSVQYWVSLKISF